MIIIMNVYIVKLVFGTACIQLKVNVWAATSRHGCYLAAVLLLSYLSVFCSPSPAHHIFFIAFDKQLDQSCLGFRRQKPSRIKARDASSNVWNVHHLYTSCNSRAANALSLFLAVTAVVTGQVWQLVSISGMSTGMVSDRPPLDRLAAPHFTPYMPCQSV